MDELRKPITGSEVQPRVRKAPRSTKKTSASFDINLPDFDSDFETACVSLYEQALQCARQDDRVLWRRMQQAVRKMVVPKLIAWREREESKTAQRNWEERAACMLSGSLQCFPLMSMALAGVESENERFNKQAGLIEDILLLPGWRHEGNVLLCRSPRTFACIYHTLHGAMCVHTQQLELAIRLAETPVLLDEYLPPDKVYRATPLTMALESMNQEWKRTSNFLFSIPDKWAWLKDIYGDIDDLKANIAAYFLALNILELCDGLKDSRKAGHGLAGVPDIMWIPSCFFLREADMTLRMRRVVQDNADAFRSIWHSKGLTDAEMKKAWQHWFAQILGSMHPVMRSNANHLNWIIELVENLTL